MECNDYQQVIVTDYLDGELDGRQKEQVEQHCRECEACRDFLALVCQRVRDPFQGMVRETPPESVWNNIAETIAREESMAAAGFIDRLAGAFRRLLTLPRPVWAVCTAGMLVLVIGLFGLNSQQTARRDQAGQQIEYLVTLGEIMVESEANGGYGTDIEAIFL